MKKILGLDIGTNSIGGALISLPELFEDYGKDGKIEWLGSRIIPTDGEYLQKFESGIPAETKAAFRRSKRGSRRLKHRYKLRRTRLIQVFKILGWLHEDFPENFKKKMNDDENFKFSIGYYLPFSKQSVNEATQLLGIQNKEGKLALPEDWIIYYLRKKALTEKITIQELARVIYMMNQRRGFKSSRKDLKDGDVTEKKWVEILKIKSVELESNEKNKKDNYKYTIVPYSTNVKPWIEERKKKPEWEEKEFTFLITEKTDEKGKVSQLKPQIPKPDDWALCTTAQDNKMDGKHPGEYFFEGLKENKNDFKIRQYAVYRIKYKKELETIWQKQLELNDELRKLNRDKILLQKLAEALYPTQAKAKMPKLNEFLSNDLLHILSNDIIYYQRELKSQKNSVGECQYEKKKGIDGEMYGLKCAPKSSPDFQEFRIWQDIHNIKILEKEKKICGYTKIDEDVTSLFINPKVKEELFEKFDTSKEITQESVFKIINNNSDLKISDETHHINMFYKADKKLQGNETKNYFRKIFSKCDYETDGEILLNDREKFYKLWHILFSITSADAEKSAKGISTALKNKNNQFNLPNEVIKSFSNSPELEMQKKYASYSTKAIRKLLPLMRVGKRWDENVIIQGAKERAKRIIERLNAINFNERKINEITDDDIQKQLLKSFIKTENLIQGLNTYQACYLVYDRHSEKVNDKTYSNVDEVDILKLIPNNSLRNPVVEQVVRETLHLVKDVWKKYGQPDEVHIELGRELKKNADEKKKATDGNNRNFNEKQRIKKVLYELINDSIGFEEYDVNKNKVTSRFSIKPNPENPRDIDKFRIWKSGSNVKDEEFEKLFKDGKKERIPTKSEIKKYILWLSQGCCSPYTGKIIPLSKLFDKTEYEIEHVIPQSKLSNDSFNNLVIAEAAINPPPYKGSMLARSFIKQFGGRELEISGRKYSILSETGYENLCKDTFKNQKGKLKNLLATEVPEDFVTRQLNDTRYITRKIAELLSPIARDKTGIIFTGGSITSELKRKWGLNKEWKKLLLPRFERLEAINKKEYIIQNKFDVNDIDINVPENPELELKRIDHRHHAMDALIIAATTREHIRYLNSLNSVDSDEELKKVQQTLVKGKIREFKTPWEKFIEEARIKLEETIVSFKTNNKVVSKPSNKFTKWEKQPDETYKKTYDNKQKPNPKWMAVRKSMFKEPQGIVYIKELVVKSFRTPREMMEIVKLQIARMQAQNTPKQKNASYIYDQDIREIVKNIIELSSGNIEAIEKYLKKFKPVNLNGEKIYTVRVAVFTEYAAKRVTLDKSFDEKKIKKIPYAKEGKSIIGELLLKHLKSSEYGNDASLAFSGEGLEALAKKAGKPITKVTIIEQKKSDSKFRNQYVEVDAGSNAYFIIYENEKTKERKEFKSLATHKAIECIVKREPLAEEKAGFRSIILSPNDLVYVPTKEERLKIINNIPVGEAIDWNRKKKIFDGIYKMVSCTGSKCEFVPHNISNSNPIIQEIELGSSNKNQRAWDGKVEFVKSDRKDKPTREDSGTMIKDICIKLRVDRLGNVKPI